LQATKSVSVLRCRPCSSLALTTPVLAQVTASISGSVLDPQNTPIRNPSLSFLLADVGMSWDPISRGTTVIRAGYSLSDINNDDVAQAIEATQFTTSLGAREIQEPALGPIPGCFCADRKTANPAPYFNNLPFAQIPSTQGRKDAKAFWIERFASSGVFALNFHQNPPSDHRNCGYTKDVLFLKKLPEDFR
jgi:hypothetical protein